MKIFIFILSAIVVHIANAQKLEQSFCGLHLGCSISEAKTVMADSVLMAEKDGFVKGTLKLIYNGNIQQVGADRTTLTFFRGSLMDIHLHYAPPYDSLTVFENFKDKLEKKFGRMKKVESKSLEFYYEVKTEGMKVELLWTKSPDGAKYIGATHLALFDLSYLELKKSWDKKPITSDGLGDF